GHVRQDRWVIDLSIVLRACVGPGSPRERLLHAAINQMYGVARNDGTDDSLRVQGIAGRQAIGAGHKLAKKFFVDLALNDDAARIEADLALMKERAERRGADRVVHVDVVEDDHRIETTKLQHGPLQEASGALRQHARRLDSADQIDDANFGTLEELVRNGARGSRRMSHNIDYPCGKPGFLRDLGEHDSR